MNIDDFRKILKEGNFSFMEENYNRERKVSFLVKTNKENIVQVVDFEGDRLEFKRMFSTHCGTNGFYELINTNLRAAFVANQFRCLSVFEGSKVFEIR